jgi:hypothetical protein
LIRLGPNGGTDSYFGLLIAVGTPLARTVKEEDDRPFFVCCPLFRQENLVPVRGVLQFNRTIQESYSILMIQIETW